jgi:hypothetical protein
MHAPRLISGPVFAALLLAQAATSQSITTLFVSNNGGSPGWGAFFDATVINPAGLRVTSFDVNVGEAANVPFTIDVYVTPTSYVGKDTTPSAWTKVATGAGVTAGRNLPSPVDTSDFVLPTGPHGIAIYYNGASPVYTNGTGSNQMFANADVSLQLGIVRTALWAGTLFNPRVWNGTIYYANKGTAAYGVYGAGCQGTNGVPQLAAAPSSLPKINTTFTLALSSMRTTGGAVIVILGPSPISVDLSSAGMPGCSLLTHVLLLTATTNSGGTGTVSYAIPNDSSLLGALFYNQALVLDPGVNAFGGVMTNGGEGVIGT